jgi:glycosyltransferase involved in cell wall biosynthesis
LTVTEDQPLHLTALVDHPDHVCCRYRLAAFRPLLAGHTLTLRLWPRHWWGWLGLARDLRGADAVLIQRRLLAGWQLHLLRGARRLLFDFDDAVFLRDSYSSRGLHSGRRRRRFAVMMRAADAVIAGNSFLAAEASRWTDPRHVTVIPTCVDPGRYPVAEQVRAGDGVQLVWVGSSSTLKGLEKIQPLLNTIGRDCPEVRLKLICDRFLELTDLPVQPCPWTEATEAAEIAAGDIGISWVPDDLWSRGKCALKVLQYMAAGLPVVANPVGVQAKLIRNGENGFLVTTPAEWVDAIRALASDPALRRRLGQAARRLVETDFSIAAGARAWRTLLDGLEQEREVA